MIAVTEYKRTVLYFGEADFLQFTLLESVLGNSLRKSNSLGLLSGKGTAQLLLEALSHFRSVVGFYSLMSWMAEGRY